MANSAKLFFDIRQTDQFSLLTLLFILLAPSIDTEDTIKKILEENTDELFQNYSMRAAYHSSKGLLNRRGSEFIEKDKMSLVEDIVTKTYSMNEEIQVAIDDLVR